MSLETVSDAVSRMSARGTEEAPDVESADQRTAHEEVTAEGDSADAEAAGLPLDVVFDVLKNERRRQVLRFLERNRPTTLSDLAEHVAALENDKPVDRLTSTERKRVYVGLYQCHLPRMDDAGVIDFDADRGTVEMGPRAGRVYEFLPERVVTGRPWPRYYLAVVIGLGALYAASLLALGTASVVPSLVVMLGMLAIGGCALAQQALNEGDDGDLEP